jgi:hypothetical protein
MDHNRVTERGTLDRRKVVFRGVFRETFGMKGTCGISRVVLAFSLLVAFCLPACAQRAEQHPYRQSILKTKVKVRSSRDKKASYRYSTWGNLSSSDRRYTQKVRLQITVTNISAVTVENLRVQYRIYKRNLSLGDYAVAAAGQIIIPQIASGRARSVLTDEATCQYRLRWSRLVRGNQSSKSGEKYAGYVVVYHDRKGPVCWDMSSQTMYAEYAKELRKKQEVSVGTTPTSLSPSGSDERSPLPYSAATTVYVSKTGRKFHRKNCRYVRGGARPMPRGDALKSGYSPCSVCNP